MIPSFLRRLGPVAFQPPYRRVSAQGVGYRYEDIDITNVADDASQRIKDLAGRSTSGVITPSLTWDTRDNAEEPESWILQLVVGGFCWGTSRCREQVL